MFLTPSSLQKRSIWDTNLVIIFVDDILHAYIIFQVNYSPMQFFIFELYVTNGID